MQTESLDDVLLAFQGLSICCRLLITFVNSLDPDQDRRNVRRS